MTDFGKLVPAWVHTLADLQAGKTAAAGGIGEWRALHQDGLERKSFWPIAVGDGGHQGGDLAKSTTIPTTALPSSPPAWPSCTSLRPEQILVTAGSTGFLDILARTLLGPGLNAVTSKLSFISYPIVTRATGAQLIEVPTLNDGYDLERILETVDVHTRVVYIANPNNPTGTLLDAQAMDRFLDRACRRMSSPCLTKPIAITPAISPPSAVSSTRTRSSMCGRNVRSLCCAPSPRRTGWLACVSATEWDRRS